MKSIYVNPGGFFNKLFWNSLPKNYLLRMADSMVKEEVRSLGSLSRLRLGHPDAGEILARLRRGFKV